MKSEKPEQSRNPEAEKGKQSKQPSTHLNFNEMKNTLFNLKQGRLTGASFPFAFFILFFLFVLKILRCNYKQFNEQKMQIKNKI